MREWGGNVESEEHIRALYLVRRCKSNVKAKRTGIRYKGQDRNLEAYFPKGADADKMLSLL